MTPRGHSTLPLAALAACVLLAAGATVAPAHTAAPPGKPFRYRYLIDSGPAQAKAASLGWNLLDVSSKDEADALPRGTRGLLWVGDYDNSSCSWQVSDAQLRSTLAAAASDPHVAGVFFSDEPDPYACPTAPAQHHARSQLIHSLDPNAFTVMLVDSNQGSHIVQQLPLWAGAADYLALDPYPCHQNARCDYGWIATVIHAADRAHVRYWGVAQAFTGDPWRWPTPAEERHMLAQWRASHAVGYMTFAWHWQGSSLASQTGLLHVFQLFNRGGRFLAAQAATPVD